MKTTRVLILYVVLVQAMLSKPYQLEVSGNYWLEGGFHKNFHNATERNFGPV